MALDTAYNAPGGVHLGRAVESYQRALGHWVPEERLLAGEFLAIAAEALSRFAIESRAHQLGMTPKNLAQLRHAADERELRRRFLADEVFTGDSDAEVAMREASNGFEHGYMQLGDVQGLLEPVLERSMGHVRRALVEALGLAPVGRRRLLDQTMTSLVGWCRRSGWWSGSYPGETLLRRCPRWMVPRSSWPGRGPLWLPTRQPTAR